MPRMTTTCRAALAALAVLALAHPSWAQIHIPPASVTGTDTPPPSPQRPPMKATPSEGIPLSPLPVPPVSENASAAAFLRAAQLALVTGRVGEAQEALEMAQTRLLDRSVPLFQTNTPSQDPGVSEISMALRTLAAGDRESTLRHIQAAVKAVGQ